MKEKDLENRGKEAEDPGKFSYEFPDPEKKPSPVRDAIRRAFTAIRGAIRKHRLLSGILLAAAALVLLGFYLRNRAEENRLLTLRYERTVLSTWKSTEVRQGNVLLASAKPLGEEHVTEFAYHWDDDERKTIPAENDCAEIVVPASFTTVGDTHTLSIAAYYGESHVYSDGHADLQEYDVYTFTLASGVSVSVSMNGTALERNGHYTVKGGETISVSASHIGGIAFIGYYFTGPDTTTKRIRDVKANEAQITVPFCEPGTELTLYVEPVSREDKAIDTDRRTKTGWTPYILSYSEKAKRGIALFSDGSYVTLGETAVTMNTPLKLRAYPEAEVECLLYSWSSETEEHRAEGGTAEFGVPYDSALGDSLSLVCRARYLDGSESKAVSTLVKIETPGESKRTGVDEETYANGDIYEGEYRDGKRNGHGIYTFANGAVYDGEWLDGKFSGHGVLTYANGDVYDGEWLEDKRSGHGIATYANGDVLEGDFDGETGSGTIR